MNIGTVLVDGEAAHLPDSASRCCTHCGNVVRTAGERFCCAGCVGAHALIGELGLSAYYARRDTPVQAQIDAIPPEDPTPYVRVDGSNCTLDLAIEGMHCAACVWLIETALARDPDVSRCRVNATQNRVSIVWSGDPGHSRQFVSLLARLGYRTAAWTEAAAARLADEEDRFLLRCLAVAGFGAANVMMLSVAVWAGEWSGSQGMETSVRDLLHWASAAIALPVLAFAIRPFARTAWASLRQGRGSMDLPVVVGVALASCASLIETIRSGPHAYFESAVMLVFFLLVGRYVERRARGRARSAAAQLAAMTAGVATIEEDDGSLRKATPAQIARGDKLLLASGERCLADATLIDEAARIDNSIVTGESVPVPIARGGAIHAGAMNVGPTVRVRVEAIGEDMLLSRLSRMLEAAEQTRSHHVALADRVARWYTPAVHLMAAVTGVAWYALGGLEPAASLMVSVSVLIVTCPCALALAQPTVSTVAINALARAKVLVTSPTALERLAQIDTIVFDKTGTLTRGKPVLVDHAEIDAADLTLAASLAATSRHPLCRALLAEVPWTAAASHVVEYPGAGLASGDIRLGSRRFCGIADDDGDDEALEMWLVQPGRPALRLAFKDAMRSDAEQTVADLRARGYRLILLSGDRARPVRIAAERLGIAEHASELTPREKLVWIESLRSSGRKVLMLGDGINDAPALAAADASIAPGDATDAASAAADALFRGEALQPVVTALDLAQGARRAMRANLRLAVIYNLLAVPIAMVGSLTPPVAALAMSSSSLLVVLNALRVGRGAPPGPIGVKP